MNRTVHRELEVAFSKHSQPVWFRIIKWTVIIAGIYFFREHDFFWPSTIILAVFALTLHFFWQYKTKGWTQSWIGWDYEKNKPNK